MYSKTPTGKASKGSVSIINSNGRLQLRFRHGGTRHYISLGVPDSPEGRKLAEMKAREIELDILSGNFDSTTAKYKPQTSLSVASPDITPKATPKLSTLWQQYVDARKKGKSPATIRMYGWVANHLDRCPHKHVSDSQAIFDWFSSNVPADSAKRIMMHLGACCRWAKKSDILGSNPFDGMSADIKVQKTGSEEEEINPFTREERGRIIEAFKTNRYYKYYTPLMEFLFFTGCRPSEAVALQWKHIGFKEITFR
jgi:integrase